MVSGSGFSRGRPVYSQGSFAPNRGQVSAQGAQGYLQRELRNQNTGGNSRFAPFPGVSRFGPDGQSDTRSGMAQSALNSTFHPRNRNRNRNNNRPTNDPGPGTNNEDDTPNTGGPLPPGNPEPPVVTINEAGQLELPYSSEWSNEVLEGLRGFNEELLGLGREQQQQGLDFTTGMRENDLAYGTQKLTSLNQNAAAGTAFSSAYGNAVAKNAATYNNARQQMETQNTNDTRFFGDERDRITDAFNQMLSQDLINRGVTLGEEQGGNLGYPDTPDVDPNQDSSVNPHGNNGNRNNGNKNKNKNKRRNRRRPNRNMRN